MTAPQSLLEVRQVSKSYDGPGADDSVNVLVDISLSVAAGDSLAVVGPSGSGKSTLLNIIGALDRPTSGTVELAGKELSTLSDEDLAAVRNTDIGFIFQLHHLLPQCTVLENVLVPTLAGPPVEGQAAIEERARRLLERVELGARLSHRPAQLSGGERLRTAVVRALVNRPRLLLGDEPTGSLDRKSADNLARLLVELNREEDVALILVTHSMALAQLMDRVFVLEDGHLVER